MHNKTDAYGELTLIEVCARLRDDHRHEPRIVRGVLFPGHSPLDVLITRVRRRWDIGVPGHVDERLLSSCDGERAIRGGFADGWLESRGLDAETWRRAERYSHCCGVHCAAYYAMAVVEG